DEPTGSLDAATGHAVIDLMFELNRAQGATLVLVTHDPALARRCGVEDRQFAGRIGHPFRHLSNFNDRFRHLEHEAE
ncbi:hypothetical protein PPH41_40155, partial [Burkholderia gladioli]|nr:hypothetical protein [Burkholderia gladioli]